jgi:DNA-binding response OmpR family regulator
MRILIVNIYPEILEMVEQVQMITDISQPDWQISVVDSGKKCLKSITDNNCPEVIIMGMLLSDISGLDLIKLIRDDSDVPIIVISDNKNIDELVAAFEAGANEYIVKPFSKAIFNARLKALIRRREWDIEAGNNGSKNIKNLNVIASKHAG